MGWRIYWNAMQYNIVGVSNPYVLQCTYCLLYCFVHNLYILYVLTCHCWYCSVGSASSEITRVHIYQSSLPRSWFAKEKNYKKDGQLF